MQKKFNFHRNLLPLKKSNHSMNDIPGRYETLFSLFSFCFDFVCFFASDDLSHMYDCNLVAYDSMLAVHAFIHLRTYKTLHSFLFTLLQWMNDLSDQVMMSSSMITYDDFGCTNNDLNVWGEYRKSYVHFKQIYVMTKSYANDEIF